MNRFRRLSLFWLLLTVALPSASWPADADGQTQPPDIQEVDLSGIDPFFAVAELVAEGKVVPQSKWDALLSTPGYRTLKERDNFDRTVFRHLPLALSPTPADGERPADLEPWAETVISHLRAAFERRDELLKFRDELVGRPLLAEAVQRAGEWLPEGTVERVAAPYMSFVVFQPDARGYDRIIVDLLLAYELPRLVEGLLAHEAHHVYRNQIRGETCWEALPEADLLYALDNLQAEGVADLIDKREMLAREDWGEGSTARTMFGLQTRFQEELGRGDQRLAEMDEVFAAYASRPAEAEELGRRLRWEILLMGGHPVGFRLASVVADVGGRDRLSRNVADPFDFLRAYQDAARVSEDEHRAFSDAALEGLERLEQVARQACED